jgi:hypothetical protein
MWFERWFLSSNAKDIGVLYLIYALFSGLVGTNDKEVHPLLSRLFNTNKEFFNKSNGKWKVGSTSVNILIGKLENIKSSN